ncbi:MAG: hypothetical protein Unbinned805contig1001_6 [Prokaryotic dsDNA virus sp.]|jgi:hypothetical protein|nr:MAG: hypothetical protein Unbinned805contig1001_6 [Prokaryotic dsDNA virus sp.]|tara:strand:- start:545 stop:1054 length:510 start_codon:yes stop_codon:yes gene_type:complete
MHEARPLIVDENNVVLGGNMRLKAFTELGYKEVWVDDMKDWSEEQKQEFVIADNVNFGEWDYDLLANQYDVVDLDTMGVELDPNMFGVDDDDSVKDAENVKFNDYTIYFANEEQMDIWYGFMKKLKNKFKDHENISSRILMYIAEVYDENKMSESELVLKFVEQEVDGE